MLGITVDGQSKAYPVKTVLREKLIQDKVVSMPVLLIVGPDKTSLRVFEAQLPMEARTLTFVRNPDDSLGAGDPLLLDRESGGTWNFKGCAVAGKWTGHCLAEVDASKDYCFDWFNHHRATAVFNK
jgi:hypothetical protein